MLEQWKGCRQPLLRGEVGRPGKCRRCCPVGPSWFWWFEHAIKRAKASVCTRSAVCVLSLKRCLTPFQLFFKMTWKCSDISLQKWAVTWTTPRCWRSPWRPTLPWKTGTASLLYSSFSTFSLSRWIWSCSRWFSKPRSCISLWMCSRFCCVLTNCTAVLPCCLQPCLCFCPRPLRCPSSNVWLRFMLYTHMHV